MFITSFLFLYVCNLLYIKIFLTSIINPIFMVNSYNIPLILPKKSS